MTQVRKGDRASIGRENEISNDGDDWRDVLRGYSEHGGKANRKERRAFEKKRKKLQQFAREHEVVMFSVDVSAITAMTHSDEFKELIDGCDGVNPEWPVLHVLFRDEVERNLCYDRLKVHEYYGAAIQVLPAYVDERYLGVI